MVFTPANALPRLPMVYALLRTDVTVVKWSMPLSNSLRTSSMDYILFRSIAPLNGG